MLDIHRTDALPDTKIYFSHSRLPTYIDPQNVSTKKRPFSTFDKQNFSHTLDLILPEELYDLVEKALYRENGVGRAVYARVHMKLGELLEEDFLDAYIRQGDIMMLSEGRPLLDNVFSLCNGTLRLELDRPTYERCGLVGTSIEDGGRKHQKSRWVIEYNLRDKAMHHGKGGFERVRWACKNVLDKSLTWLFYNFHPGSDESLKEGTEVLSRHAPKICEMEPSVARLGNVRVPALGEDLNAIHEEEEALSLLEYIHLMSLESPRLQEKDDIDSHLSRYEVPDFGQGTEERNMVRTRWRGFIAPAFIRELFLAVRKEACKKKSAKHVEGDANMEDEIEEEKEWFAMSAQGFGGKAAWAAIQFAGRETLVWEIEC